MYYSGYLFDFDGTLVDSMPTFATVTCRILDEFNVPYGPDIYRRAAAQMGLPIEDVLFLDDNLGATSTAVSAGMSVCGVYDDTSAENEEKIRSVCHHYIRDFALLPNLTKG